MRIFLTFHLFFAHKDAKNSQNSCNPLKTNRTKSAVAVGQ